MIREFFKGKVRDAPREVHALSNAHRNPKQVAGWIADVEEVHKRRVAPTVFYSRKMPDVDALMQIWEPEFEPVVARTHLEDPALPLSTEQLVRVACNLSDVPVHEPDPANPRNLIESLHVLFQLYSAFTSNDHFQTTTAFSHNAIAPLQRIEFN
jgi:intraflagellar transport protein 46